jgi:hypothetical protein
MVEKKKNKALMLTSFMDKKYARSFETSNVSSGHSTYHQEQMKLIIINYNEEYSKKQIIIIIKNIINE